MRQDKKDSIEAVVRREWDFFQKVQNEGGRADCQDNWETFHIMRSAQYDFWPKEIIDHMDQFLQDAARQGRNPVMEKYARMMASTVPERYKELEPYLPYVSVACRNLTEDLITVHKRWMAEHARRYPNLSARGRRLYTEQDTEWETSAETYLRGELLTWPRELLEEYLAFVQDCERRGINLVIEQDRSMISSYGYASLEEADEKNSI